MSGPEVVSPAEVGYVDAHAHVFRPASVYPRGVDALVPADRDAPVEDFATLMAESGVTRAVLVPLDGHDDYVADVVERYPHRFLGIAVATRDEHGLTGNPVEALLRRRARFPFVALRTMWLGPATRPIEVSPMFPTLQRMAEDGIALWSYLAPDQLPLLIQLVERLPTLTVVLNHLGFTPHDMAIDEAVRPRFDNALPPTLVDKICSLASQPNVYLMLSGHYALSVDEPPYRDLHIATRRLADAYGAARMMWGSDYPWIRDVPGYDQTLNLVRTLLPDFDEESVQRVLGGTARSLFTFPEPPTADLCKEMN